MTWTYFHGLYLDLRFNMSQGTKEENNADNKLSAQDTYSPQATWIPTCMLALGTTSFENEPQIEEREFQTYKKIVRDVCGQSFLSTDTILTQKRYPYINRPYSDLIKCIGESEQNQTLMSRINETEIFIYCSFRRPTRHRARTE